MADSKLVVGLDASSLAAAIANEFAKGKVKLELSHGTKSLLSVGPAKLPGGFVAARYIVRAAGLPFLGSTEFESAEVDSWVDFINQKFGRKLNVDASVKVIQQLEKHLLQRTYFVGSTLSLADVAVYAGLQYGAPSADTYAADQFPCVARWFASVDAIPEFRAAVAFWEQNSSSTKKLAAVTATAAEKKKDGSFVELEGAVEGKVVTRFPPEASGYLHIGHAKAAMLNQYFARKYKGKLIMRFDDTNPAKENAEFEKVILEDLQLLDIKPDVFTHTSDHFDRLSDFCEQLLKEGKAFVDDTPAEQMAAQRRSLEASKNRNNAPAKNLEMWAAMKAGTDYGVTCCVRAKIDFKSANGCLRDPVLYRCKPEPHVRTGDKYKVYPTYDFACPIVDSVEGVTHALRTTEYHDRDEQYRWVCEAVGLRLPIVWDFSRLNLKYTVMSKRQLTWFVDKGRVDGWSDPRFPTVRGILRHGLTVQGLRKFILDMGSSKASVLMEWDKIWSDNKKVIDPTAPRHTALDASTLIPITVLGIDAAETKTVNLHPKDASIGTKQIRVGPKIFLEAEDANTLQENTSVTLMEWGNAKVTSVERQGDKVTSATLTLDLADTDFKGKSKFTWLLNSADEQAVDIEAVSFAPLITSEIVAKGEDLESAARDQTRFSAKFVGSPSMADLKVGDIIQISRKGFFIVDKAANPMLQQPLVLFSIPDGSQKTLAFADASAAAAVDTDKVQQLEEQVRAQAAVVKELRTSKADKDDIKKADARLKELKAELKALQGDSKAPAAKSKGNAAPAAAAAAAAAAPAAAAASDADPAAVSAIEARIVEHGNAVRDLKAQKQDFKAALEQLQAAKKEYKELTGQDYKPGASAGAARSQQPKKAKEQAKPAAAKDEAAITLTAEEQALVDKLEAQGQKVRELKAAKAEKDAVAAEVDALKKLKAELADRYGKEVNGGVVKQVAAKAAKPAKQEKAAKAAKSAAKDAGKGETKLGIQNPKEAEFADWYSEVITKSEMIEYFDISGCYVLRPWSYQIWEFIKEFLDTNFKSTGVENCYFPCFVSKAALEKEKEHIADFAPEVAWVTKSGDKDLEVPIAIRPTSETVMYPSYAKWIQSHRDLPLKLNQWCNVVRWEFKQPTPFLRTREFLWQEGHTAFADQKEAIAEVHTILGFYAAVYEELLAIPVVRGRKTEKEKFAGGDFTTTVEAFVPTVGRGIQGATSHHLGQNFAKMFGIQYEDPNSAGEKTFVYQNSWGLTTRTIGVLIMVHGDDKGLVLPPRVAPVQVIVIPTGLGNKGVDVGVLVDTCNKIADDLNAAGCRAKVDARDNYSPPWKYNHWELKGVPLRIEIGPKDIEAKKAKIVRRDNGAKSFLGISDVAPGIKTLLDTIQAELYQKALKQRDDRLKIVDKWEDFNPLLDEKNMLLVPFCGVPDCEKKIKEESTRVDIVDSSAPAMGAKSLCIPFEQKPVPEGIKCICPGCDTVVTNRTLFGRSY